MRRARARLRWRRFSGGSATLGLTAVLLLLLAFGMVGSLSARSGVLAVGNGFELAQSFDNARLADDLWSRRLDSYRRRPTAANLANYRAADASLTVTFSTAADLDAVTGTTRANDDAQLVGEAITLRQESTVRTAALLAAIDAGDTQLAAQLDLDSVDPIDSRLYDVLLQLSTSHRADAAAQLAALTTLIMFFAIATPAALVASLALIGFFWRQRGRIATLERAQLAAEGAKRARSAFLATMSHELRTPLNAILGFSQLGLERPGLDETQRSYLQHVREAGVRQLQLVNEVLDLANLESGATQLHPEQTRLATVLEPAVTSARQLAEAKGLTFEVRAPGDTELIVDVDRTRQIVAKLLTNAVKFTPARGRVTLMARVDDRVLVIEVADSGVGIPPERRAQIFDALADHPKDPAASPGVHLALLKALVELSGGTITFESTVGGGTTFRVRLPGVAGVSTDGPRLLIVDHQHSDVALVRALAWECRLPVEVATSVATALAAIDRSPPIAVVLGLRLPDGRGEQVLAALRALPTRIPVVVVTVEEPGAVLLDVDDFITKPADPARLRAWLRSLERAEEGAHANTPR